MHDSSLCAFLDRACIDTVFSAALRLVRFTEQIKQLRDIGDSPFTAIGYFCISSCLPRCKKSGRGTSGRRSLKRESVAVPSKPQELHVFDDHENSQRLGVITLKYRGYQEIQFD
jgi:hypothetical protein